MVGQMRSLLPSGSQFEEFDGWTRLYQRLTWLCSAVGLFLNAVFCQSRVTTHHVVTDKMATLNEDENSGTMPRMPRHTGSPLKPAGAER